MSFLSRCFKSFLPTASVVMLSAPANSGNQWETHIESYSFAEMCKDLNVDLVESDYFPVGWDIRQAYQDFRKYSEIYTMLPGDLKEPGFEALLDEASDAGINFMAVRNEFPYRSISDQNDEELRYVLDEIVLRDMYAFLGGLRGVADHTDSGSSRNDHNESIITYVDELVNSPSPYRNSIIAGGMMNCPDAYERGTGDRGFFETAAYLSGRYEQDIGIPFFSFLESQGSRYRWSEGPDGYIARYCSEMHLPSYDLYPIAGLCAISSFPNHTFEDFVSADVLPEEPNSNYHNAYANRDEIISLAYSGRPPALRATVHSVVTDPLTGQVALIPSAASVSLPDFTGENYDYSSSGALSGDIGDRPDSRLNGGVAFWETGAGYNKAAVLCNLFGEVETIQLETSHSSPAVRFLTMGQDDYGINHSRSNEGILSQDEMRVLSCFTTGSGSHVDILAPPEDAGEPFSVAGSITLSFEPAGGVWGYFWPEDTGNPWDEYYLSAFVVYDEVGRYAVVHRNCGESSEESWICNEVNPADDLLFGDLNGGVIGDVIVHRGPSDSAQYSLFNDCIAGAVLKSGENMRLVVRNGRWEENYRFQTDESENTIVVEDCSPEPGQDIEIVIVSSPSGDQELFVELTGDGEPGVYRSEPFSEAIYDPEIVSTIECEDFFFWIPSLITDGVRIRPTRKPLTTIALLQGDEDSSLLYPYIFKCRWTEPGSDHMESLHESIEAEHDWGVVYPASRLSPARHNCLMNTVQAYGRHNMGGESMCPSLDSLMYLCVSPIIHGARGLIFYNLGSALQGSPGGAPGSARLPWEMTAWNAGFDPEAPELDMVSTVHAATAILTGNSYQGYGGTGVDMLSTVVNQEWDAIPSSILRDSHGVSSITAVGTGPSREDINFLAFQNPSSGEIRVIVSNDHHSEAHTAGIAFPALLPDRWTVRQLYPCEVIDHSSGSDFLEINLNGFPPFTARLYSISHDD